MVVNDKLKQYLEEEKILEFASDEECMNYFNTYDYQNFRTVAEMKEYQGKYGFNIGTKRYHINCDEALDIWENMLPFEDIQSDNIVCPKIKGIAYQLSEGDSYSYWSGFTLSKEDEDAITKILAKYETDGCAVSGTSREVIEEAVPAAMFKLDTSKKPVQIAMHQVKMHLLCLADECNSARIKAVSESKIYSEIQYHMSMQHIYSQLAKLIPDGNDRFGIEKSSSERIAENAFERMKEKNEEDVITSVKEYVEKWLTDHGYTYTLKLNMNSRLQWYVRSKGKDIPHILLISEPQSEDHLLDALEHFDKTAKNLCKKEVSYEKY